MSEPTYGQPHGDVELRAYAAVMGQAFAIAPADALGWVRDKGEDCIRIVRDKGVKAGLALYKFGQFFGDRSVPAWGAAGVAVPPEHRGTGHSGRLMKGLLAEMYDAGIPLAPLYPASNALYRRFGWETAGTRLVCSMEPTRIRPPASTLSLEPVREVDSEIERRYRSVAVHRNGNLDRNRQIWSRVTSTDDNAPLCGYLAGDDGYILFTQNRPTTGFKYELVVRDVVFEQVESLNAIVRLLALHGTQVSSISLPCAPADPLLRVALPDQFVSVRERFDWMLRVVRVKDALLARGYPDVLSGQARIAVRDESLPDNDGVYELRLERGNLAVQTITADAPLMDIRGLAALYSGNASTRELRSLSLLQGTTEHDAFLNAMFRGSPPWMPDFF